MKITTGLSSRVPKGRILQNFARQLAGYILAFAVLIPIFHIINMYIFCLNITYAESAAVFFIATTLNVARNPFRTNA